MVSTCSYYLLFTSYQLLLRGARQSTLGRRRYGLLRGGVEGGAALGAEFIGWLHLAATLGTEAPFVGAALLQDWFRYTGQLPLLEN